MASALLVGLQLMAGAQIRNGSVNGGYATWVALIFDFCCVCALIKYIV